MLETLGIDFQSILITAVGFLLLFVILKKFAFGPIIGVLQQRQDTIRGNFDEAESRRNEMVKLQHEYEDRLAKIEDEARDKIQAAVKEAQIARDEIITRAHADSQAIMARGQADIEQQRQQSMVQMRDQVVDLATQMASRVAKTDLNAQSHAHLVDEVISGLGSNGTAQMSTHAAGGAA